MCPKDELLFLLYRWERTTETAGLKLLVGAFVHRKAGGEPRLTMALPYMSPMEIPRECELQDTHFWIRKRIRKQYCLINTRNTFKDIMNLLFLGMWF